MHENRFREEFTPNRNLVYGTLISLLIETLRITNDPHADIGLKNRHLSILNQVRQLLIDNDKK
jgi:hypothetical protein